MTEKEPNNKNEHINAIEQLVDIFDDAAANSGITISANQARYILLMLKHYLELVKKLNGIWR